MWFRCCCCCCCWWWCCCCWCWGGGASVTGSGEVASTEMKSKKRRNGIKACSSQLFESVLVLRLQSQLHSSRNYPLIGILAGFSQDSLRDSWRREKKMEKEEEKKEKGILGRGERGILEHCIRQIRSEDHKQPYRIPTGAATSPNRIHQATQRILERIFVMPWYRHESGLAESSCFSCFFPRISLSWRRGEEGLEKSNNSTADERRGGVWARQTEQGATEGRGWGLTNQTTIPDWTL